MYSQTVSDTGARNKIYNIIYPKFKRLKILFNIHNCIIVIFTILVKLIIPQVDAYLRIAIIHKVLYLFLQPDGAAILH